MGKQIHISVKTRGKADEKHVERILNKIKEISSIRKAKASIGVFGEYKDRNFESERLYDKKYKK